MYESIDIKENKVFIRKYSHYYTYFKFFLNLLFCLVYVNKEKVGAIFMNIKVLCEQEVDLDAHLC